MELPSRLSDEIAKCLALKVPSPNALIRIQRLTMEDAIYPARYRINSDLEHRLKHYVYAYVDPRDKSIFYIGKGVGSRALAHLADLSETRKVERIKEIRNSGGEPRIDILTFGLRDDEEASRVEAALIETFGRERLTNSIGGLGSVEFPRRPLRDLIFEMSAQPVSITEPSLLIRINRNFRYGMSDLDLYEATRGIWVVGSRRMRVVLAMAVYDGIIREVYNVDSWHPAGSTPRSDKEKQAELSLEAGRRWEFVGNVASELIRDKYVGGSVQSYFKPGQQQPLVGVNLKPEG